MSAYQANKSKQVAAGYQNALADINAIIATTYGSDEDRLARVAEWIDNNRATDAKPMFDARVAEFLS